MTPRSGAPRVLVTGGAGVIGRHLVRRLVGGGAVVCCYDLEPRPSDFPCDVIHVQGDANDARLATIESLAPEVCYHLAATFERTAESPEFWSDNFHHNVLLSHHMMTLLPRLESLRRVIFASSYLVYDPALYLSADPPVAPASLRESSPIQPRNLCGAAKLHHELELRFLAAFPQNFSSAAARIFRVYGEGSEDIVSRWIRSLLEDENRSLEAFRTEGRFDYIYAGDVAEGLIRLADSRATGTVNLGTGRSRSVQDVLDILQTHFPASGWHAVASDIPIEAHQADITRLRTVTGWQPSTTLEEGIERLIEYYRGRERAEGGWFSPHTGVLITSASRKVPLVQSYRKVAPSVRVWAGDIDEIAVASFFADDFWLMPRLSDVDLAALGQQCRERGIGLVVPTRDGELAFWAEAKAALSLEGTEVMISPLSVVRRCLDKLSFAEWCADEEIWAVPTFTDPASIESEWLVVKERFGAGGRGAGIRLNLEHAIRHASSLENPIFQPFLDGSEYSVDVYVGRDGVVVGAVPRTRTRVHAGESVISETVEAPELLSASVQLAERVGLRGHAVIQAFATHAGFRFLECNARVGGASTLSFEAGLHTPEWSLREARGETLKPRVGAYVRGLRLVRHSVDRFVPA